MSGTGHLPRDLEDSEYRADPYPTYRWYRENSPVHLLQPCAADSVPRYLITCWEDVEAGLKNPVLKRTIHSGALWNQPLDEVPLPLRTYARITREWPLFRDPPNHAPIRRPVNRVLEAAQNTETLTNIIQLAVSDLSGRDVFDAAEDFARRVVLQQNLAMLGMENRDWQELGQHLQNISHGLGNVFNFSRLEKASRSMEVVEQWVEEAAQLHPASDAQKPAPFLTRLLDLESAGAITGRAQLAATAILLIQAGQDTTSALLANGILTLLRHPNFVGRLIEQPGFTDQVVEEILRYESPVQQITRHASDPLEIRGVKVNAGEGVSFLLGAANRDPAVFANPEIFDPIMARTRTAAFGFGPHGCPGASLGRQTVGRALRAFFCAFSNLRLASDTISWKPLVTFRSVSNLWVRP